MKNFRNTLAKAGTILLVMTILCGIIYTVFVTVIAQILCKNKANGSIIEVGGTKYGCELLAQNFTDDAHMWGRVMKLNTTTFRDNNGSPVLYAGPSNLSPDSDELKQIVEERVEMILASNPDSDINKIPQDLVTCSGSGMDPDISLAAAQYQVARIAKNNNMSQTQVESIIKSCTNHKLLGIFGEDTVNVLKVNLMLEGILQE